MPEWVKEALAPATLAAMSTAVKGLGAGAGVGGLLGAGAGGALGAVQGYRHQRQHGADVGHALAGGLRGALPGIGAGALAGAGVGGIAGALKPMQALAMGQKPGLLQSASHFGQRQVHALTGVGGAQYARSVGGGAHDAVERYEAARKAVDAVHELHPDRVPAMREFTKARQWRDAALESERQGITSLPGYAKALWKNPADAVAAGVKDQWHSMGTGGRALMYGLPALSVAGELAHSEDESGKGKGRFQRAGEMLGTATGALAPLPIVGDLAFGGALSGSLGQVGKRLDTRSALRNLQKRRGEQVSLPPEPRGETTPSEYIASDRASGVIPESVTA